MFAASKTDGSAVAPDAQFNYVTMLLHGDGTNGAQNNTFLDSSTNNFTITRNGNTTQGSFSPYGSNWSANLPATVLSGLQFDRIGTTSSFNFMHNSSALWTLELWVNISALPSSSFPIFSNNDSTSSGIGVTVSINSSGQVVLFITNGSSGNPVCSNTFTTTAISTNSWTHIALVYNQSLASSNANLYINGIASGSANKTGNSPSASNASLAAELFSYATGGSSYAFNGYASNLRITNSAVYSSAFTPSTTPLTAIANTQLLAFQSNRFVDNSTNAYAIVPRTTQSIQRFNPFGASTAYSTSVIGGSAYFDGSGDYLSNSPTPANFGSGDFTAEAWVWFNSNTSGYQPIFTNAGTIDQEGWVVITETNNTINVYTSNLNTWTWNISTSYIPTINCWTHIALVRNGSTLALYVNGVSRGTTNISTNSIGTASNAFYTGYYPYFPGGARSFNGYISNMRLVKGTAVYTSNFTPPTTPLTAVTNTSLLLSNTNGAIFDNAMMNDLETVGNAQISTSVVKYGTGSMYFDGTGDYLKGAYSPWLALGTGDYTIEMWVNFNSVSTSVFFGNISGTGAGDWAFFYNSSVGVLRFSMNNTALYLSSSSWTPSTGTWYHIAICRASGTYRFFVNGTVTGSGSDSTNISYTSGNPFYIGSTNDQQLQLNGYIDDLRITNGYARYTSSFTPPTAAFPNTGPL